MHLNANNSSVGRIFLATTARPTLLLIVSLLSYINVVRGRPVLLGRGDWVIWLPALLLLGVGTGASLAMAETQVTAVWKFCIAWTSVIVLVVVFCFGRLLAAVIRVRREQSFREEPVMIERQNGTTVFLPPSECTNEQKKK